MVVGIISGLIVWIVGIAAQVAWNLGRVHQVRRDLGYQVSDGVVVGPAFFASIAGTRPVEDDTAESVRVVRSSDTESIAVALSIFRGIGLDAHLVSGRQPHSAIEVSNVFTVGSWSGNDFVDEILSRRFPGFVIVGKSLPDSQFDEVQYQCGTHTFHDDKTRAFAFIARTLLNGDPQVVNMAWGHHGAETLAATRFWRDRRKQIPALRRSELFCVIEFSRARDGLQYQRIIDITDQAIGR